MLGRDPMELQLAAAPASSDLRPPRQHAVVRPLLSARGALLLAAAAGQHGAASTHRRGLEAAGRWSTEMRRERAQRGEGGSEHTIAPQS